MNAFLPTKSRMPKEDLMSSSVVRFLASPNPTSFMSLESILTHKMFSGCQRNKTVNSIFHFYDKIIMALNRCWIGGMACFLFMQKQRYVFNLEFFSSGLTLVLISSSRWETLEVSFWCYPQGLWCPRVFRYCLKNGEFYIPFSNKCVHTCRT